MSISIRPLLATTLTGALLLTSACDQVDSDSIERQAAECVVDNSSEDEPSQAQSLAFSKELVVSDGINEVTLVIASDDQELLAQYDEETFEIEPIFERPEGFEAIAAEAGDQGDDSTIEGAHDFSDSVLVEEKTTRLEPGAIGYMLHENRPAFRHGFQCSSGNKYTSSKDFAWVTIQGGICTEAKISTKKYSWSWYDEKAHATVLCAGQTLDAGKANTNRVKLEVCPGPSYTHGFYN